MDGGCGRVLYLRVNAWLIGRLRERAAAEQERVPGRAVSTSDVARGILIAALLEGSEHG